MSTEGPTQPPPPALAFTAHPSLVAFQVPYKVHLSNLSTFTSTQFSTITPYFIATGALVFDSRSRILLIQRASTDSMPNLWEIPGGACDEEDPTILHGLARELYEESGLIASKIGPLVGRGHVFLTSRGKVVCKYNFIVRIDDADENRNNEASKEGRDAWVKVRLDPNEHQSYVWATEEEVQTGKVGGVELRFTKAEQKQVILDAFQVRKPMEHNSAAEEEGRTAAG